MERRSLAMSHPDLEVSPLAEAAAHAGALDAAEVVGLVAAADDVLWSYSPLLDRTLYLHPTSPGASRAVDAGAWRAAVHPDDRERFAAALQQAFATGQAELVYRMCRADGEVRWLHDRARRVDDPDGGVRIVGFARDVTGFKRTETHAELMDAVVATVSEGLSVSDERGRCSVFNPQMETITGYTQADAERAGLFTRLFPDRGVRKRAVATMAQAWRGEDLVNQQWRIVRKDGRPRDVLISTRILGQGGARRLLAAVRDITERCRSDEERWAVERRLREAERLESLGVMAGGIAHDFNNLLTSVLGYADLALRELPPASPARELIESAVDGARRAAELTQQMLAYSGHGRFVVAPLDLSAIARDMLRLLEVSISKKCKLVLELDDHLPPIEADAGQVRQVVMNLAINASEAIGDGSGQITIRTGVTECDHDQLNQFYLDPKIEPGTYVFLDVTDDGCGMSKETIARIFEPFFTTKFTGRGLGLSALLGIVRGHRGAVRIYSEVGRGSTFRVLFPLSRATSIPAAPKEPTTRAWRGHGIALVVDDDASVAALAGRMLESLGFSVVYAGDGHQALEVYAAHAAEVRLVLLDVTMPQLDGEGTLGELRARHGDVKVILSSGYDESTAMQRIAAQGRPAFIQKPYRFSQFAALVREVVGSTDSK